MKVYDRLAFHSKQPIVMSLRRGRLASLYGRKATVTVVNKGKACFFSLQFKRI